MCGIYGITGHNPTFIQNYINRCKHRGPDGQDVWSDENISLGHTRLAIVDLNGSQQPMLSLIHI